LIRPNSSLRELAFVVCDALDRAGVVAVLSGGGAATIHSEETYLSRDLDFIVTYHGAAGSGRVLEELGFVLQGQSYHHSETPFYVEFPQGPLMVGNEAVSEWLTLEEGGRKLHLLTPTDSVRDRLAAYLHWNDHHSLEVALAVAVRNPIDLTVVEDWCRREGRPERFKTFARRLRG
jgi:hypothetical protein